MTSVEQHQQPSANNTSSSAAISASASGPAAAANGVPRVAVPPSAVPGGAVNGVAPPFVAPVATSASASLYVGELHPDVTEAVLYELFSQIGPVSSIRICRDAITRRSLGYAYVNFHSLIDCERALDTLNYTPIKGQPCRIMWSQRDPAMRRSGVGNVFIKSLDASIDNKALHDTFSAFGHILSCKVVLDERGESRGYGFVHFETQEAADQAIEKVNGMLLNGKKVFVGPHITRKERRSKLDELKANFTNVFFKNLDESVDEERLKTIFEPFGEIQSMIIQRDDDGKSRGFGFVNYVSHDGAQAAVDKLNETEIDGKTIFVGRAQKKAERVEELRRQFESLKMERLGKFHGVNLYVKNLDDQVDEERFRAEFAPFGAISSAKIMFDEQNRSRGFGFVCYEHPEEASRAISEMNGKMIFGKPIYVALAQRKDERRAQLEGQFAQRAQQLRYQQMAGAAGVGIYQQGPIFYPAGPAGMMAPGMPPARFMPGAYPAGPGVGGYQMMPPHLAAAAAAGGAVLPPGSASIRPMRPMRGGFRGAPMPMPMGPGAPMMPGQPIPQQMPFQRRPYARFGPNVRPQGRPDMPLTAAALASAPPEQQKRILGERLFPLIQARDADHASKITGMLLEMDNGELLHLLESPEALSAKVSEALEVLRQHKAAQEQQK